MNGHHPPSASHEMSAVSAEITIPFQVFPERVVVGMSARALHILRKAYACTCARPGFTEPQSYIVKLG